MTERTPTMADALAAGDGTLNGAIDYWQERASAQRAVMRQALAAIEAEMGADWECNSHHPKMHAARDALRAALSATQEKP